jgi:hypothetical protein
VLVNKFPEWDRHLLFDDTRIVDVSRNAEELGTLIALTTESGKPGSTTTNDCWRDGDSLDIRNCSRATKEADIGRELLLRNWSSVFAQVCDCKKR